MHRQIAVISLIVIWSFAVSARAALVVDGTEAALGTFGVSNSDLVNQGTASLAGQTNTGGSRYGSDVTGLGLNNGLMYPVSGLKGTTGGNDSYCPGNGSAITFSLDLASQPAGYTIGQIVSMTGYVASRQSQKFRIDYSTVGDPGFVTLADETQIDFVTNNANTETKVLIYDDTLAPLATEVDQIRVTYYDTGGTLPETVYRELDVFSNCYVPPEQGVFTDTSQIRCQANGNVPIAGGSLVAAAVNFYYDSTPPDGKLDGSTILGIAFDDIYIGAAGSNATFALAANQPGVTLTTDFVTFLNREQAVNISGTDGTVATTMMKDMHTFHFDEDHAFTLGGLVADCQVYVQMFGGDDDWDGWPDVFANGVWIDRWHAGDNNNTTGSYFGFSTVTDANGQLLLEFPIGEGNYAGISGIIVHYSVPEPATLGLLALGGLCLLALRRRKPSRG